jgi:hypothetical protein
MKTPDQKQSTRRHFMASNVMNLGALACFRLGAPEFESVASEVVGTFVDKEQFRELYERGVAGDHSFLWIYYLCYRWSSQ